MKELLPLLHGDALTVTGKTLAENVARRPNFAIRMSSARSTIRLQPEGGTAVLRGNLAPDGAVIKHAAATPRTAAAPGPRRRLHAIWMTCTRASTTRTST